MVKQIYLVMGSGGAYEDFRSWPVKGFADEGLAKDWAEKATVSARIVAGKNREIEAEKRKWIDEHRVISRIDKFRLKVDFIDVTKEEFDQKLQEFMARSGEFSNPYDTEHWGGYPDDNDTYDYSIIDYDDSTPSSA